MRSFLEEIDYNERIPLMHKRISYSQIEQNKKLITISENCLYYSNQNLEVILKFFFS